MVITPVRRQKRVFFSRAAFFSVVLIILQIFVQNDIASAENWDSLPLSGGEILSIVMDPTDESTVYTGTKDAGVFKTTNGGTSWQPARSGLTFMPIRSLAMDPHNSKVLYAGTDFNGIWKTTNAGNSWFYAGSGLDTGKSVTAIVINPLNTQIIYAGLRSDYYGNIYKSENGGATWIRKDNGLPVYYEKHTRNVVALTIDPVNPGTLYAGTTWDGAFKTTDGGENWLAINCGIPVAGTFNEVQALTLDPHHTNRLSGIIGNSYYIFNTSPSPACWTKIGDQTGSGLGTHHLYFHPTDASILFSAGGGVFGSFSKSTDGGQTWSEEFSDVNEIAFHNTYPETIYAATVKFGSESEGFTSGGVYKTINGGTTWSEATIGIQARVISNVAVDPQDSQNIYTIVGIDTETQLLKSQDGGQTWQQGDNFSESGMSFLAVNPHLPQQIYTGSGSFGNLYFSNDHGNSFTAISQVSGGPTSIAFCSAFPGVIYVGTSQNGVYKSTDSGSTWVQKNNGLPSNIWVDSVAVDPNNSLVIWAGTNEQKGVFKSVDGGDHWTLKGLKDDFDAHKILSMAVNPDNSNDIVAGTGTFGHGSIYRTTNGGATWEQKITDIGWVYTLKFDPRNASLIYAATEGTGVIRSTDGGETWQDYSKGIFYPVVYSLKITNENPPLLVTGSYGSGLYSFQERITVSPLSGLKTTEEGGTANFSVVLNTQPTADVTIGLSSSDITEGTVSPAALVFNAGNWDTAQTAIVTGVDDNDNDDDIAYTIRTAAAVSDDGEYSGRNAEDVRLTNIDNDELLCFPVKNRSGKMTIICL